MSPGFPPFGQTNGRPNAKSFTTYIVFYSVFRGVDTPITTGVYFRPETDHFTENTLLACALDTHTCFKQL